MLLNFLINQQLKIKEVGNAKTITILDIMVVFIYLGKISKDETQAIIT